MGKIIHITYQDIVYERPLQIFGLKHCTVGLGIRRCMHTSVTKGFKKKGKTEDKKELILTHSGSTLKAAVKITTTVESLAYDLLVNA